MVSLTLNSKWLIFGVFIVSTLVATATSQRIPTFWTRRTTTTTRRTTTTTPRTTRTTPTTTTTTTTKPYVYKRPESCSEPPPYTTTTEATTAETTAAPSKSSAQAQGTQKKLGTCSLPATAKQVAGKDRRWPNNTVPYTISDQFTTCQHDLILTAMYEIANKSCIRFREKTDADVDYVEILSNGSTCVTFDTGYVGGKHTIRLSGEILYQGNYGSCFYMQGSGYTPGSGLAAHEIMHLLGFNHEHQRPDRNQSIVVNYENILPGQEYNFNIVEGQTVIGPYDLNSVMHYRSDAFAKEGTHSMDSIIPGREIQEGDFLSDTDVFKLKTYYECP